MLLSIQTMLVHSLRFMCIIENGNNDRSAAFAKTTKPERSCSSIIVDRRWTLSISALGSFAQRKSLLLHWEHPSYTIAETTRTQSLPDWIGSNQRALHFFGGVPALLVPDNLKPATHKAPRYEPVVNRTYTRFAAHYGTAILPTRPYKPQDIAKAEAGVLLVERWIMAVLRHREYFSLAQLNQAIAQLLPVLNGRAFQGRPKSRRDLFETLDRPALSVLPDTVYKYDEWSKAKVNIDYHVSIDYTLVQRTKQIGWSHSRQPHYCHWH